jgi:hypothetical protein
VEEARVVWTESEQAIVDYLAGEPGPARQAGPPGPGGWVAFTPSGGPGADLATIQFRKSRTFPDCQLHWVTFSSQAGRPTHAFFRAWPEPDGSWLVNHIGGGSGGGPYRNRPWVNFTAQWNDGLFAAGGEVTGDGAQQAHLVRLRFADGTSIEDRVENGVVLFFVSPGVAFPARVDILDNAAVSLASYDADEFNP